MMPCLHGSAPQLGAVNEIPLSADGGHVAGACVQDCSGCHGRSSNGVAFSMNVLNTRGLKKRYGTKPALCGVTLSLRPGITAILGPNGSGKSTLLRCLAGILQPDEGEINFAGRCYPDALPEIRSGLGFLPQELDFPGEMTPLRLLRYLAQLKFLNEKEVDSYLDILGLKGMKSRPFSNLSMGETRLVGLAQALMGTPHLLILDEPFHGLDVFERASILRAIQTSAQSRIVVFSAHVPNEIESLANRVVILLEGRVIYAGGVEELRRQATGQVYEMSLSSLDEAASLSGMTISRRSERNGKTILRVIGLAPDDVVLIPVEPTLEDAYLLVMHQTSSLADRSNAAKRQIDAS
jgi:ABC-2 type transport system ATP-binding protein